MGAPLRNKPLKQSIVSVRVYFVRVFMLKWYILQAEMFSHKSVCVIFSYKVGQHEEGRHREFNIII